MRISRCYRPAAVKFQMPLVLLCGLFVVANLTLVQAGHAQSQTTSFSKSFGKRPNGLDTSSTCNRQPPIFHGSSTVETYECWTVVPASTTPVLEYKQTWTVSFDPAKSPYEDIEETRYGALGSRNGAPERGLIAWDLREIRPGVEFWDEIERKPIRSVRHIRYHTELTPDKKSLRGAFTRTVYFLQTPGSKRNLSLVNSAAGYVNRPLGIATARIVAQEQDQLKQLFENHLNTSTWSELHALEGLDMFATLNSTTRNSLPPDAPVIRRRETFYGYQAATTVAPLEHVTTTNKVGHLLQERQATLVNGRAPYVAFDISAIHRDKKKTVTQTNGLDSTTEIQHEASKEFDRETVLIQGAEIMTFRKDQNAPTRQVTRLSYPGVSVNDCDKHDSHLAKFTKNSRDVATEIGLGLQKKFKELTLTLPQPLVEPLPLCPPHGK